MSLIAWSMQASHWARSAAPIANGMWRMRSRGWPKRSTKCCGAAEPAAQIPEQMLARALQIRAVGGAQFAVAGLEVHHVVEALDQ